MQMLLERLHEGMTADQYSEPNFGAWVKEKMDAHGIKLKTLAAASDLVYSYLSRLINSGSHGKPITPERENIRAIADALIKLGAIESQDEAFLAAGYHVSGYVTIRADKLHHTTPEDWQKYPQILADLDRIVQQYPDKAEELLKVAIKGLEPHLLLLDMLKAQQSTQASPSSEGESEPKSTE